MTRSGHVHLSASTWQQAILLVQGPHPLTSGVPPATTAARAALVDHIAGRILAFGPRRVRVAVDGLTGAGKTTLGHELAQRVADTGRNASG